MLGWQAHALSMCILRSLCQGLINRTDQFLTIIQSVEWVSDEKWTPAIKVWSTIFFSTATKKLLLFHSNRTKPMICERTQKLNSNKFGMLLFGFCPTYLQLGVTFATFWLMLNDSLRARYNLFENSRPSWFWLSSSSHDKRRVVKCWVVPSHFFQLMPPRRWKKTYFGTKRTPIIENKVLSFRTMLSA